MSDPYVYTPRVNYRNSPYLAPFSIQANSPFIPNINLSGSPYSPNIPLPPPNLGGTHSPFVPFPAGSVDDDDDYYSEPYARPRTTSWTGGVIPENIPNVASWYPPRRPQRRRSRSDAGYFDQPQVVNINNGYWLSPGTPLTYSPLPPPAPQLAMHPYLDGHAPRGDIYFDLMAPSFAPMRRLANNQYIFITHEELSQVATHPPIYATQLHNDLIPAWPVDMVYNTLERYSAVAPPLKVGDILSAIYKALNMRISTSTWEQLPPQEIEMVTGVFTTRCRSMGRMEMAVRSDGVKRVDFLHGKRWFRGITLTNDPKVLKFHVTA